MKIISNETGETIANILTNHSMTLDEALDLVGAEPLEAENSCDPDYILNGVELWYDDLDLVPDNYGEESEDERTVLPSPAKAPAVIVGTSPGNATAV